jgi:hypothetical protein
LPIRGAEADDFAGKDEQTLKVGCNMAQAFETPKGVTGERILATRDQLWREPPRSTQQRIFQIAAPGPTRWPDRHWNMGLPPDRRKRIDAG